MAVFSIFPKSNVAGLNYLYPVTKLLVGLEIIKLIYQFSFEVRHLTEQHKQFCHEVKTFRFIFDKI